LPANRITLKSPGRSRPKKFRLIVSYREVPVPAIYFSR